MSKLTETLFFLWHQYSYFKVQEEHMQLKTLTKKSILVDLNELPKNTEAFLEEVNTYCKKQKEEYEIVNPAFPGTVRIEDELYDVGVVGKATGVGGICYSLIFIKKK